MFVLVSYKYDGPIELCMEKGINFPLLYKTCLINIHKFVCVKAFSYIMMSFDIDQILANDLPNNRLIGLTRIV